MTPHNKLIIKAKKVILFLSQLIFFPFCGKYKSYSLGTVSEVKQENQHNQCRVIVNESVHE